jgi:hypothetical protein
LPLRIPNLCIFLFGPISLTFIVSFTRALFRSRWPWIAVWLPALLFAPTDIRSFFLVVHHPDTALYGALPFWCFTANVSLDAAYGLADVAAFAANYFRLGDESE